MVPGGEIDVEELAEKEETKCFSALLLVEATGVLRDGCGTLVDSSL